jgi:hypothetical protein
MKVSYHIDKFVDNNGIEREFILAAVSIDLRKDKSVIYSEAAIGVTTGEAAYDMEKVLCLGIAVRRPEDTFNEALGMTIAKGKALKALTDPSKGKLLFASDAGLINTKMVQALLEQEALYFKRDPRCYIAGYERPSSKE